MITKGTIIALSAAVMAGLLFFIALSDSSEAETIVCDGYIYEVDGSEAVFTGVSEMTPVGKIDIPSTITYLSEEYPVTGLADGSIPRNTWHLSLGKNIETVNLAAFERNDVLLELLVDEENTAICAIGNVLFTFDDTELLFYPHGRPGTVYTVPYMTETIGPHAFSYCSSLVTVMIASTVTSIKEGAFEYCTSLTGIELPEDLAELGDGAFRGCMGLKELPELPTDTIGPYLFSECVGITEVGIPENITTVSEYAFGSCSKISYLSVPEGVSVDAKAFDGLTFYATDGSTVSGDALAGITFYGSGVIPDLYDSRTGYTITFDNGDDAVTSKKMTTVDGKLPSLPQYEFIFVTDKWYDSNGELVTTDTVFTEDTTVYSYLENPSNHDDDSNADNLIIGGLIISGIVAAVIAMIVFSRRV